MILQELSYGWIIIAIGAVFFVLEVFSPGFFLLVPGTVLIIIGILVLLGIDIFSSGYGIILAVVLAMAAALVTVILYSRLTREDEKPFTTSMDSLVGKTGIVSVKTDSESTSGKVQIDNQIWSAKSLESVIEPGSKVKVISSQGVHIVVQEIE